MPAKKAAAEKAKLEAALKAAADDARRLFVSHEKDRRVMEQADKAASDAELFDRVRERERLRHEHNEYVEIVSDLRDIRQVYLEEAKRHDAWNKVKEFSWLPDVDSEAQITAFLSAWKESQEYAMGMMNTDKTVHFKYSFGNTASLMMRNVQMDSLVLQRIDTAPAATFRKERLDEDLQYCVHAVRLTEEIWKAADLAWLNGQHQTFEKHRAHIKLVNEHIQGALDRLTCVIGQNLDVFIDLEEETVMRVAPSKDPREGKEAKEVTPDIKYGIWVRNSEKRVNVNQIKYADLGIYIDPRDSQNVRLPRALGLQQATNIAMRAMQLSFDPCSVLCPDNVCQNYIALDCILVLESITFPERLKKLSDWQCRVESANSFELHRNEYPPKQERGFSSQSDDITMKISFELPKTVAMRQHSLMIGKWNPTKCCWEHCSTASMIQESIRRFAFLTADLTVLAVIQEKGFDVPYERWHLRPVSSDEVLFSIEGRHRGESSDREIVIAIRENLCRLVGPEDPEVAHLRTQWLPPPTLLRLLARAGYNFILNDVDGQNLPHILTKSKALESKVYADMALFASTYAFSSSHHNKAGEDKDTALFRISKERLAEDMDNGLDPDPEDENKWWSVRYETERCTLAQFSERDHDAQLSCLPGRVTHLNLFKILAAEHGEDLINRTVKDSNPLLQQGVLAVLSIVRPFTWG